jgi:hypothetical protein
MCSLAHHAAAVVAVRGPRQRRIGDATVAMRVSSMSPRGLSGLACLPALTLAACAYASGWPTKRADPATARLEKPCRSKTERPTEACRSAVEGGGHPPSRQVYYVYSAPHGFTTATAPPRVRPDPHPSTHGGRDWCWCWTKRQGYPRSMRPTGVVCSPRGRHRTPRECAVE